MNDVTRALFAQDRYSGFRDVDDAKQVRLDLGTKVREFRILDGADVAIAGVIDKHVEAAERLYRRIDRVARGLLVGHVERKRPNSGAIPIDQISELAWIARRSEQPVAFGKHRLSQLAAQSPRTSRD